MVAKIISGIGVSLSSGTNSSLLYDTLKRLGKEDEHKIYAGKLAVITNVSMAFVFIIGAYLFSLNAKLPAYASLPLVFIGFVLTFFFKEPYAPSKKFNFRNSWIHLKEGLVYFWNHNFLRFIGFYVLPVAAAVSIGYSVSSAFFEKISIPIFLIGVCAFIASMIAAYFSKKAHFLEENLGLEKSLFWMYILSVVSFLLMAFMFNYVGFLFYLIIPLVAGLYEIITNDYANKNVASSHRATVLSVKNMFMNIGIFLLFPLFGSLTGTYSMGFAYAILGLIFFVYGIILMFFWRKEFVKFRS